MEAQERTRGTMREIKVGDDVIITDVRNVLGNNDKTSDSVEEYMAKVVSITQGVGGDTWYTCKLAVINKTLTFPQWEVFLMDKTTKDANKKTAYELLRDELHELEMLENGINIYDTVWVDMSNWSKWAPTPPHESGYAEIMSYYDAPDFCNDTYKRYYNVRFRGSDDLVTVHESRLKPVYIYHQDEEKDTQEDTAHDKHYREAVVEPILVMQALFSHDEFIGFLKGNILKYRLRAGHKGGAEEMKADLDKIHVYEEWIEKAKKGERI